MAVSVTRLPDEPILIAQVTERMNLASIRALFRETAALCADASCTVYRVIDVLEAEASINDLARALVEAKRNVRGSVVDPQIVSVLVAGPNRLRFIPDLLARKEFGGLNLPIFASLDEALAYLRAEMLASHSTAAKV